MGWRTGYCAPCHALCHAAQVAEPTGTLVSTEAPRHLLVSAIPWGIQIPGLIPFVLLLFPRLDFWYVFDLVLILETSRLRSEGL